MKISSSSLYVLLAHLLPTATSFAPLVTTGGRRHGAAHPSVSSSSSWSSLSLPATTTTTFLAMSSTREDTEKDSKLKKTGGSGGMSDFLDDVSGFDVSSLTKNLDVSSLTKNLDVSSLTKTFDSLRENVMSGEFGSRGEAYVAAQFALIACVVFGGIPIVGGPLMLVLGPGLFLVGIGTIVLAVPEMKESFSPWPVPGETNKSLVRDGVFSKVRHPMYAGTIAACVGFSMFLGDPQRLLLTAGLAYLLNVKADLEEEKLRENFPEYDQYCKDVPGKFFPQEILDAMPWKRD